MNRLEIPEENQLTLVRFRAYTRDQGLGSAFVLLGARPSIR
jgi:hypothetical protein